MFREGLSRNNGKEKNEKKIVRLDDLIHEIYETEAPDLPGFIDKEQQKRIEARIMAGINELEGKEMKKVGKRRFVVLGLAAVLLMGLCFSVFAGSNPDWDVEIIKFMGLDESDTFQLESGEVKIQVYDRCEAVEYESGKSEGEAGSSQNETLQKTKKREIKVMAVSSIGDRNSACIRIETDYDFPEGFKEETDYILPDNYSINVTDKKGKFLEHGSTLGYVNLDGKLGYMLYITGCEGINKAKISIKFKDFYLHHDLGLEEGDREEELLLEGSWELDWRYAYKSNTKRYKMLKSIEMDGDHLMITKIDVSPLSVQIKGFRMPWERKYGHVEFTIDRIVYKDGTSLEVGGWSSAGNRDGIFIDIFLGTEEMGTTIDVEQIESIVIGGNKIVLR